MSRSSIPYQIFQLGDSALTIDFGNTISEELNREVIRRFHQLNRSQPAGHIETVPAYSSLTVYYDPLIIMSSANDQPAFEIFKGRLEELLATDTDYSHTSEKITRIPVCYEGEFAPDLPAIAGMAGIEKEEVIRLHTEREYHVYMLGFLPGFAYMGKLNEKLAAPRKPVPKKVMAGSVGIAGSQTGIYPLDSPGGWQIIGRTPLKLFDLSKEDPILLQAGNKIHFYPITRDEFESY